MISTETASVVEPKPADATAGRSDAEHGSRFRADVAGLRAVAVGLVLIYHAGVGFLPGGFVGVDVFFVISGFLITRQLVDEIGRTGRVSLTGFYARRAKRILPAATIVLIATAVATWLFVTRERWHDIGGDLFASAVYVVNWRFADRAVDYLAIDVDPSPVQHFWSLAVEEQFYLVWPLLIIATIFIARRLRRSDPRPVLWIGLLAIAVPSFAWSIIQTASSPERAFFVSTTRMWELAVGAAVALVAARLGRIPRAAAIVLGWLGLSAIVVAALFITASSAWPGYLAAVPVLGSAAVIAAGVSAGARGPVAILGTRPFQWVGDLSYSLYLWHWPMIVIAGARFGDLSVKQGLVVAAASVVPAWITFKIIENPLRYARAISKSPRLALSLGGNFTLVGVCAGLALIMLAAASTPPGVVVRYAPGAAVLLGQTGRGGLVPDQFDFITPNPIKAGDDLPDTTADKCFQQMVKPDLLYCTYGKPDGKTTVALVGDSKADQWLPSFQLLAEQNDWKIVVAFKGACALSTAPALTGDDPSKPYQDCTDWNKALLARLLADKPAYVFTSQVSGKSQDANGGATVDAMVDGMHDAWQQLEDNGSKVLVIANNPGPSTNAMTCVDKYRTNLAKCAFDPARRNLDAGFKTQQIAVAGHKSVKMIDLFDTICPTDKCPAVIGNVMIYRRGSHITATYMKTMTPQLAQAMNEAGVTVRYT
ncbi:acyltransferase family protein [Asanoa iriomotensis]|uniref:Acyltransferase n=1 Tax=Asanoa iriomotensis TaxID=234613 RepID=A0ABQ4CCF2_9ACTN|nr:acyltransferase family protein [Asanoa iriomotensis]GIF60457.1 acyltransferase [Asanoa iriomotensis]